MLQASNPEYEVTVNDLSVSACQTARAQFGLDTICCTIGDLKDHGRKFDVALVIDSIYYVTNINRAWESLSACLNQEGTILLRLPNKMWWIGPLQRLKGLLGMNRQADRVYGLNPEHVYVFTRSYLKKRLARLGFEKIVFYPSPPLHCERKLAEFLSRLIYGFSMAVYYLSIRRVCISPSQLVLASRKG
jgi:2-polyprenyl-3-methyl-5-hydroxy-6-metoxy-1,4-benzoquinol methylase